jgi:hypothetical protein
MLKLIKYELNKSKKLLIGCFAFLILLTFLSFIAHVTNPIFSDILIGLLASFITTLLSPIIILYSFYLYYPYISKKPEFQLLSELNNPYKIIASKITVSLIVGFILLSVFSLNIYINLINDLNTVVSHVPADINNFSTDSTDNMYTEVIGNIKNHPIRILMICLYFITNVINKIIIAYFSITLNNTLFYDKNNKILLSFLVFIGLNIFHFIFTILIIIIDSTFVLIIIFFILLASTVIMYIASSRMIEKKLNQQ